MTALAIRDEIALLGCDNTSTSWVGDGELGGSGLMPSPSSGGGLEFAVLEEGEVALSSAYGSGLESPILSSVVDMTELFKYLNVVFCTLCFVCNDNCE